MVEKKINFIWNLLIRLSSKVTGLSVTVLSLSIIIINICNCQSLYNLSVYLSRSVWFILYICLYIFCMCVQMFVFCNWWKMLFLDYLAAFYFYSMMNSSLDPKRRKKTEFDLMFTTLWSFFYRQIKMMVELVTSACVWMTFDIFRCQFFFYSIPWQPKKNYDSCLMILQANLLFFMAIYI